LVLIALGSLWRLSLAVEPVAGCTPPGGTQAASGRSPLSPALLAEKVTTWPETGLGLMYARASHARLCWSQSTDYYVALHADRFAPDATNLGDIVISPGFQLNRAELRALAGHEAHHRSQWAVLTVLGGPFAFPIAYGIDNFFFPASRNHFERLAGLEAGLYPRTGTGPVLGPPQIAVLVIVPVGIALLIARRRRNSKSSSRGPETDVSTGHLDKP
jgi:hypothetical protein